MEIAFSDHALRQLQERNLSKASVEKTVREPLKVIEQSPRRFRALRPIRKDSKRYLLVVIYDVKNSAKEIVTAFITGKFEKYL